MATEVIFISALIGVVVFAVGFWVGFLAGVESARKEYQKPWGGSTIKIINGPGIGMKASIKSVAGNTIELESPLAESPWPSRWD